MAVTSGKLSSPSMRLTSTETVRLIRDGEVVGEVGGEGDYIPIATLSHHQNDSSIKMGSDESHFNVSL